ncbi:hypothetical protein [Calycomorphotria hydatis]|uniref:Carboxypeptidase regulatory-like domain-containing protein n=1 Tax=Calycomorphotria hydatis TaxID=2528027 RepID=A0A517TA26_9PLAN|nr:hypothetical protein [Calycomorphotria hydatis]QDT65230.1 hypothetical protein V22_24770 [Calycomorphotria hydatis]
MKNSAQVATVTILLTVMGLGCSLGNSDRVEVSGEVTLDAAPLKDGAISFFPLADGAVVGATIQDGTFRIPRRKGPKPGIYRVEIDSAAPTGKKTTEFDGVTIGEEYASIIPMNYNRQSVLEAELKSDDANELKFDLRSSQ